MFNKYEIWFGAECIGTTGKFEKALDLAADILLTITKYPNEKEPDEYQLLQIRCYHWIDRLFKIKGKNYSGIQYTIVVWSEIKKNFVINE